MKKAVIEASRIVFYGEDTAPFVEGFAAQLDSRAEIRGSRTP